VSDAAKPLRVALVTTYYPRHEGDHAGVFVHDLVRHVRELGVEVDVVGPGVYDDHGLAYGLGVFKNSLRRPWRVPLMLWSMLRAVRRAAKTADLVHVYWLLAAPMGLLSGRPWVITLQGSGTAGPFRDLALLTRGRWLVAPILRQARAVICVSERLAEAADAIGANAVFIPNGATIPAEIGEEADPPEILYAGRMVEEKGIRELADAASDLNLVIAGDGPLRHLLPQAMGLVPHDELERLYARAAIMVIPSYREGLSVVCVEAMAHGLPVVASDIPGLAELVVDGETGLLVPARDAAALRSALLRLLDDPDLRRRMGRAGRDRVRERYDWRQIAHETLATYERALER